MLLSILDVYRKILSERLTEKYDWEVSWLLTSSKRTLDAKLPYSDNFQYSSIWAFFIFVNFKRSFFFVHAILSVLEIEGSRVITTLPPPAPAPHTTLVQYKNYQTYHNYNKKDRGWSVIFRCGRISLTDITLIV